MRWVAFLALQDQLIPQGINHTIMFLLVDYPIPYILSAGQCLCTDSHTDSSAAKLLK